MARSFPLEEQLLSGSSSVGPSSTQGAADGASYGPKLSKIRAKFRHVQSLLTDQPKTGSSSGGGGHVHSQATSQSHTTFAASAAAAAAQQQYNHWINSQIHRSRSPSAFVDRDSSFETRPSPREQFGEMSF